MEQVLLNLAVNARDAMPEGGKLTIETASVVLDEQYAHQSGDVARGAHVLLSVTDEGVGMAPEVRARIFEPFFSTKESKGTGLGLSTVYGIVKQSGGQVSVESEPGAGSTFRVYLPRDESTETALPSSSPTAQRAVAPSTILVVEDEAGIRDLIRKVLTSRGHRVLCAATPEEALTLAAQEPLALVITDVMLPGMRGPQLVETLKQSRPDLKVLFMSGSSENPVANREVSDPNLHFIAKPFTTAFLSRQVEALLPQR
jgi:CheY-like chemotaxis protein